MGRLSARPIPAPKISERRLSLSFGIASLDPGRLGHGRLGDPVTCRQIVRRCRAVSIAADNYRAKGGTHVRLSQDRRPVLVPRARIS